MAKNNNGFMHVCFIVETYISSRGFAGNSVHDRAKTLVKKGVKVSVVTALGDRDLRFEIKDGVKIYRIRCGKIYIATFIFKSLIKILQINRIEKINVIHAHWAGVAGFTAVLASRILGIPSVVTCKGFDVNFSDRHPEYGAYRSKIVRFLVKFTLKHVDKIKCISNVLKEKIETLWGIKRDDIAVIYPAVDDYFLNKATCICRSNSNCITILTVGGVREIKRIEDVLNALKMLREEGITVKYLIAGSDLGNLSKLKRLAQELNISDKIEFLGYINRENLPDLYSRADIYVCPSVLEGFGVSYLEAMARKKPIILTSNAGCSEIITHMKNGIIVPPYDPQSIAKYIGILAKNPSLAKEIGEAGYKLVKEGYTYNRLANELIELYKEVINQKSGNKT